MQLTNALLCFYYCSLYITSTAFGPLAPVIASARALQHIRISTNLDSYLPCSTLNPTLLSSFPLLLSAVHKWTQRPCPDHTGVRSNLQDLLLPLLLPHCHAARLSRQLTKHSFYLPREHRLALLREAPCLCP